MSDPAALPRYVQISEHLIREIAAGRLPEGSRLPPERRMANDLGIAVGTLRRALGDLTEKGLLDRRQGSGNYVRKIPKDAGIYAFFRLEMIDGGGLPTATTLDVRRLPKPSRAPYCGPCGEAHRVRRLRRLAGRPAALEEIWIDGARASDLGEPSESLYRHLRTRFGLIIVRVEDRIGLGRVPAWGDGLSIAAGAPCGYVERIGWAQDGERAEWSQTWFDPAVARYVARMG
jgi:GntR family transcriptional regulator